MRLKGINLEKEISPLLDAYADETKKAVHEEVISAAKKAVAELQSTSPKRTGFYARHWTYDEENAIYVTVYNKRDYRLTHLLENGHINSNGTRTKAIVHIEPVADMIESELQENIAARLKG